MTQLEKIKNMKRNYDHELTEHSGMNAIKAHQRGKLLDVALNVTIGGLMLAVGFKAAQYVINLFFPPSAM